MDRNITDADADVIAEKIIEKTKGDHECRFGDIDPAELQEVVESHRHFNNLMSMTGTTIWRTVLVIGVTGFVGLILAGAVVKGKKALGL